MKITSKQTLFLIAFFLIAFAACKAQQGLPEMSIEKSEIDRLLQTLSADEMVGRHATDGRGGINKAASFIEAEFEKAGLAKPEGQNSFLQKFNLLKPASQKAKLTVAGKELPAEAVYMYSPAEKIAWGQADLELFEINAEHPFREKIGLLMSLPANGTKYFVKVDTKHADIFKGYTKYFSSQGSFIDNPKANHFVFACTDLPFEGVLAEASQEFKKQEMFNVVGLIKGTSKPDETVLFSAHYDHIGVLKPVAGDSIANGADDDASGVSAVIALAKYFKTQENVGRTLAFVCFTAEEIGGYGSQYYSKGIDPAKTVAMFNIEMIGKVSKFGKNSAFITGYEKSDFGKILNKSAEGTGFKFHPDPYPSENLFYRSDNATLAKLGVPAHTVSTTQMDKDTYYHTVNDEYATLDTDNILSIVKAIALGARTIVSGEATPSRIAKE